MRIIERGTPPNEQPIEGRCRNCKTIFEFMQHEAKRISDQRDGDYWHLNCPVCNQTVSVNVR